MLAFPENFLSVPARIFVLPYVLTSGTVNIPGLNFSESFTADPCNPAEIIIPESAEVQGSGIISNLGIHITTDNDVSVFFLSAADPTITSNDIYLALPLEMLGTEYITLGYTTTTPMPTEFTLVATNDSTQVTITPSANTLDGKQAGVPFNITLNKFDTYQLQAGYFQDLSGSELVSTIPIAVFAGGKCPYIPHGFSYCDFIVEQMIPVDNWGLSFIVSEFTRGSARPDPLRVLASQENTTVNITPPVPGSPFLLNRGELIEVLIEEPHEIAADKPVLVALYGTGQDWAQAQGDPCEVLIPSMEHYLKSYAFIVPSQEEYLNDYASFVIPTAAIPSLMLDGISVTPSIFDPVGTTGYSYGAINVSDGCHIVTADEPFGLWVYGWGYAVSYGYVGGLKAITEPRIVTGGGWIPGEPPGPGNKRTFGFNAHSESGMTWGQLQFIDHGRRLKVHSDTIQTLTVESGDSVANFSGNCSVGWSSDRISTYSFECKVMDRGEPGRGVDWFKIDVFDSDENLYYSAGNFLGGGNIQIHRPENDIIGGNISSSGTEDMVENSEFGVQIAEFRLFQNNPNPFSSLTAISYQLKAPSHTSLKIYDLTGRLVETLVDTRQEPGIYQIKWHGKDNSSGIYFYRLKSAEFNATKKLILLR
jgi:hypothetical protein